MSPFIKKSNNCSIANALILVSFSLCIVFSSCVDELVKNANAIAAEYETLIEQFNTLRSELEGKGCTKQEAEAKKIRDEISNLNAHKVRKSIKDNDLTETRISEWKSKLESYNSRYESLRNDCSANPKPEDADRDGIADNLDECKYKSGIEPHGCPDSDGDGFYTNDARTKVDKCPDEYSKTNNGCPEESAATTASSTTTAQNESPEPTDSDGDGVYNIFDDCPYEYGIKRCKGCKDSDKDGICDQYDKCKGEKGVEPDGCPKIKCDKDSRVAYIEESALCSEVLKSCTLTIKPQKRVVLEDFKISATAGGGTLDYLLKDNSGRTLFSRKDANTSSGISKFFVDSPLQAKKTYQLILNPKGDLEIKTHCVSNFNNENIQLSYKSKPFIKQITFCQ